MHIPDGFINSAPTIVATSVASAGTIAYSLKVAKDKLDERAVPMVGLVAAFVFAGQMVNFPVLPGVSGHLMGGALAAILLGPWMGALVLAIVLAVQAIGFADGGITVLGANISLMSIVAALGGYAAFRVLAKTLPSTRGAYLGAAAVAAWASVVLASALCTVYLTFGGPAGPEAFAPFLTVMVSTHALIGVGEAVITVAVLSAVLATRPDLIATADVLSDVREAVQPA